MVQPEWRARLRRSVEQRQGDHWTSWLHLGVMAGYEGENDAARSAWETSVDRAPSAWAYRNLAVLAAREERLSAAADLMVRAQALRPDVPTLAVEACQALVRAGRPREVFALISGLPETVRAYPRLRVVEAQAALEADELDRVQAITDDELGGPDIREG
ncbi:MAG: hypothetical protein R6V58_14060, partial [Planctomycetota bacterium]